jgi:hypothetical protein
MALSAESQLIALVNGDEPIAMLRLAVDRRSLQGIEKQRLNPEVQPLYC